MNDINHTAWKQRKSSFSCATIKTTEKKMIPQEGQFSVKRFTFFLGTGGVKRGHK
jgi:hypothetical protein